MCAVQPSTAVKPAPKLRARCCLECGSEFTTAVAHGDFCGAACRKAFNNRRMVRGAELYDLFMVLRYERKLATRLKVWKLICRMALGFRDEDRAERDSRKSWRPARKVLERHTYLHATNIGTDCTGRGRS